MLSLLTKMTRVEPVSQRLLPSMSLESWFPRVVSAVSLLRDPLRYRILYPVISPFWEFEGGGCHRSTMLYEGQMRVSATIKIL